MCNIIKKGMEMNVSSLDDLKELNKKKDEVKKSVKKYIIINPEIPIKSGEDITEKTKKMYNIFLNKFH